MVLGKHSGRRALGIVSKMGHVLTPDEMDALFPLFKEWADDKKVVSDEDLRRCLPACPGPCPAEIDGG